MRGVSAGPAPYFFPDLAIRWALTGLGADLAVSLYLAPLLQTALAAAGWVLVCDFLFGKSPARRFVVLALHALPLLIVAWRGADVFYAHLLTQFHYGAWAVAPWLLRLSLQVLEPGGGKKEDAFPPVVLSAGLVALLSATAASDLFIAPWFVAPMGGSAVLLALAGRLAWRRVFQFVGLLAAGLVLGRFVLFEFGVSLGFEAAKYTPGKELGLGATFQAMGVTLAHLWNLAGRNPAEAAVYLVFLFAAGWRAAAALKPSLRGRIPSALKVPEGLRHSLAAVFVPAAMLSTLVIAAAAGLALDIFGYMDPKAPAHFVIGNLLRYYLPVLFLPLFAGWAILPGRAFRAAAFPALAVCAAAVAAPKIARIDFAALDFYGAPLYQCFAENARRLNWRAGIGALGFDRLFLEVPGAEVERMMAVGTFRRPQPGQSFIVADQNYNLNLSGKYDFAVLNFHNGRIFGEPPLPGEEGCADGPEACLVADNSILDAAAARAAFGEPKEEIECEGLGFWHYDPPLNFNFPDGKHPYLTPIARW